MPDWILVRVSFLYTVWSRKCICPAQIGVNKDLWSGYALSANSDPFGGMSKMSPGPTGSISL